MDKNVNDAGNSQQEYVYDIGNMRFVVKPVYPDKEAGAADSILATLYKLMKSDLDST